MLGPEFALADDGNRLGTINLANSFVYGSRNRRRHDRGFHAVCDSGGHSDGQGQLLDSLNTLLLHGTMSSSTQRQHSDGGERRPGRGARRI